MNEKKSSSKLGGMMYPDRVVENSEIAKSGRTTTYEANLEIERYHTDGYFSHAQFMDFNYRERSELLLGNC